MTKKYRINKLRLTEISLVDIPAEPNSLISIFKRASSPEQETDMADKDMATMVAEMQTATATIETLTKRAEAAETAKGEADKTIAELQERVAKVAPATDDDILKAITDPSVRSAVEAMQKQNKAAAAMIAKLADEKADAQSVALVKSEYSHLPVKAEDFGPIVKRAAGALSAEDMAEINRVLKAANALAGDVLKVRGSSFVTKALAGAEAEIDDKAKELAKASAGSMTYAQAYAKVLQDNPALYSRYMDESGGSVQ